MSGIDVATFLQPAFDNLFELIVDVLSKLSGTKAANTVTNWKDELGRIQAVLVVAEQKQFSDNNVQKWLQDLKDVAYDMEDVLELLASQTHEMELLTICQKILGCFCFGHMKENLSIEEKVADITERLAHIQKPNTTFQLILIPLLAKQQQSSEQTLQTESFRCRRETVATVSEPKVFERDEIKEEIITRLLKDDDQSNMNYVMIPIVGKGGIGKTTLAQHVYDDDRLKDHFNNLMAWVCVSDVFDVKRITTLIIKKFDKNAPAVEFSDQDQAKNRLKQLVMGSKFLIVLDDIWNYEYELWDKLQAPFQHAAKGSKVIMTTRDKKIARLMNTNSKHDNIINLQGLSGDACWDIVQQHANNRTDLAGLRTNIISKCQGLPLAAKVLGGLLKTKDTSRECQQLLESDIWSKDENTVFPILRLSYYHLPSHLKRVFAYCSVFPKDYTFQEMEVVFLWMAQGFLPNDKETIGQDYIHELVSRSLLEVGSSSQKYFKMHDLIHDLALRAAGDICHIMDAKYIREVDKKRARHVFLTKDAATTLGSEFPQASKLRTLDCNLYDVSSIKSLDFIQNFSCIRALKLQSNTIEVLPDCIWDLKLLRLLELNAPSIKELSKSINNLWNLQTLIMLNCEKLKNLPNIGSLKKLRCLDFDSGSLGEMPWGIENLTNLRILRRLFILGNGHGSRVKELKNLNYLQGELRICGLEKVLKADDAKEVQLHEKCDLDKLSLEWESYEEQQVDDNNTQGDVLEQLKPPTNIKTCELVGYMGWKMPGWLGDPSFTSTVAIKLKKLEKCERLPPLGQLPSLERLEIESMNSIKQIGYEFYGDLIRCSNAFPALKHLQFKSMPSWEKWVHPVVENGISAFAKLEALEIENCRLLEGELPSHLPHVRALDIRNCKYMSISLGSLPSLVDFVVWDCEKLIITSGDSYELAYLTKLNIRKCPNLESLPSQMLTSTSLQRLTIVDCPKLQWIPEEGLPINLKHLIIRNGVVKELWWLQSLRITDAASEESMSVPSSLREIEIRDIKNLKNLRAGNCTNLTSLEVFRCPNLKTLVGNFTSLKKLSLSGCPKLQSLPQGILNSLEHLSLMGLGSSTDAVESIPSPDLALPPSLRDLWIFGFQNLKSMKCSALPNLAGVVIAGCPKFEFFDDNTLPPQLRDVNIIGCELVEQHLKSDPDGRIRVDGELYSLAFHPYIQTGT